MWTSSPVSRAAYGFFNGCFWLCFKERQSKVSCRMCEPARTYDSIIGLPRPTCEVRADSPHRARLLMPQLCLAYSLLPEAQRLHPATSARFATAANIMVR